MTVLRRTRLAATIIGRSGSTVGQRDGGITVIGSRSLTRELTIRDLELIIRTETLKTKHKSILCTTTSRARLSELGRDQALESIEKKCRSQVLVLTELQVTSAMLMSCLQKDAGQDRLQIRHKTLKIP